VTPSAIFTWARAAVKRVWGSRLWYRKAHFSDRLRWQRTGIVAMVVVAAVLSMAETYIAHGELARIARGDTAIHVIQNQLGVPLDDADAKLTAAVKDKPDDVDLVGKGTTYQVDVTEVQQEIATAAANDIGGNDGAQQIQFIDGLVTTYTQLVNQAVDDYGYDPAHALSTAELGYATSVLSGDLGYGADGTCDLTLDSACRSAIDTEKREQEALSNSFWLNGSKFWWPLLAPVLVLLLLLAETSRTLWRGFRQLFSGRMLIAACLTAVVTIVVGLTAPTSAGAGFAYNDAWRFTAPVLFLAACVCTVWGYRRRLADYSFTRT
jgi:hypothetical protein